MSSFFCVRLAVENARPKDSIDKEVIEKWEEKKNEKKCTTELKLQWFLKVCWP